MDLGPDRVIAGKYRLKRHLARGGMGAVWCAEHLELGVEVALKVLRPEMLESDRAEARFRREARAAAQLKCPQVVQVHDFGVSEGIPYLVMELLEGEDLEDFLNREGPLDLETAVSIVAQVCRGLKWVHQSGLVHRDIKPSNLFLSRHGSEAPVVKLLDFGIAKPAVATNTQATTAGLVLGSPAFMSPEQARGRDVDARSDLWSLGAVFYQILAGRAPFGGVHASDVVVRICTEDAPPLSEHRPELGSEVDAFFRRALSRDLQQRFQDAASFAEAARSLLEGASPQSRPALTPERSPGRAFETAPLPQVMSDMGEEPRGTHASHDLSEERRLRMVWMPLVFLVLGCACIAVYVVATREGASTPPRSTPRTAQSAKDHDDFSRDRGPKQLTPVEGSDANMPSTKPSSAPEPSARAEPASIPAPAATTSKAPATAPLPQKKPSREQPKTDPVFGLPLDSP